MRYILFLSGNQKKLIYDVRIQIIDSMALRRFDNEQLKVYLFNMF